jgi:F-type H+-transporting ATPase subunit delta
MNDLIQASPELVVVLKSPVIKGDKKEKILEALTKDKLDIISSSFNRLLVKKGREAYLPEIVSAFIQQYKEYKGIHIVSLTTAVPVSEEVKSAIVGKISASSHMKEVELKTKVNPDIIGGFIIEVDGRLVDVSILYDLSVIKKQFESNDFIYKIR